MQEKILELLPGIKTNVPLAPYTTFQIGGAAKYFFVAKKTRDILEAVRAAKKCRVPFFVLAGGSNVLVSDKGFPGLVILIRTTNYKLPARLATQGVAGGQSTTLYAQAGVDFPVIVREAGKQGLAGLEWAGGLPGSVGGAVRGNAGAFAGEVKDNLVSAEALDGQGRVRKLTNKQCGFSYRSSVFKEKNWIVLSATFQLRRGDKKKIQQEAQEHIAYRNERHPLEYPNAGSVFKNCGLKKFSNKQQKELSHVVKVDPFPVVPTAYLISEAGLKGLRAGNAEVSKKHPNYIVKLGNASAQDVLMLIEKVKKQIKKKFSVDLEQEIQFVA